MIERVRVGMIGTSWWADGQLLPNLKSHPQADVAAICGRSRERAEVLAKKYDIARVYTDYREMIKLAELDAVVIAAPDDLHYPMTMAALDTGLHVVCEKPLASNAQQAREIYARAQAVGVKHMCFFTNRWLPPYQFLAHQLRQGSIGRIHDCTFEYLSSYGLHDPYMWRLAGRRANGALGDIGPHMIDLARWCVGEINKVSARLAVHLARDDYTFEPANDAAMLLLQFASGAQGFMHVSLSTQLGAQEAQQKFVAHGDAGTLIADLPDPAQVTIHVNRQRMPISAEAYGGVDPYRPFDVFEKQSAGCRAFIDAIVNDQPITPNFYDGLKVQEVIDAAIESAHTGCAVSIP